MRLSCVGWKTWLCLVGILLLALAIRCFHLGHNSLWIDEFLSLECSSGWARTDQQFSGETLQAPDLINLNHARPWTHIWSSIATDENHPPLYFIVLRAWRVMFGESAAALRSLSVVAAMIALVLIFCIGATVRSPAAGLWAALLMALAAPQIQQAQDARSYMLMLAACLAAALALVRMDRLGPNGWRCAALCFASLIAALLHYMALATIGAMALYVLLGMRGSSRRWAGFSLFAFGCIYLLLWGPALVTQHFHMLDDTHWLVDDQPTHAGNTLIDLLTAPARMFVDLDLDQDKFPFVWLAGAAFVLPVLLYRKHRETLLWGIWFLVPVGVALVIDVTTGRRSLSLSKYTIAAAPAVFIMLGILASQMKRIGWLPAAFVVGCCAICIPTIFRPSTQPDWREMTAFISQRCGPDDPVLFVDAEPDAYCSIRLLSVEYYLHDSHRPLYLMDRPARGEIWQRLLRTTDACIIASDIKALKMSIIPGLRLDHGELIPGMAVAGTLSAPRTDATLATTYKPAIAR